MKMYNMKMNFSLSVAPAALNELSSICGMPDLIVLNDAAIFSMTQTVPFIPNDDALSQYAEAIKLTLSEKTTITSCNFSGYEFFKEVEIDNANTNFDALVNKSTGLIIKGKIDEGIDRIDNLEVAKAVLRNIVKTDKSEVINHEK